MTTSPWPSHPKIKSGVRVTFRDEPDTNDPDESGGTRTWNDWRESPTGKWWVSDYFRGSDYMGGTWSWSNYQWFENKVTQKPYHLRLVGGHDTYGIAFLIDELDDAGKDLLQELEDTAIVDDEYLLELEYELIGETWEYLLPDVQRELSSKYGFDCDECEADDASLEGQFHQAREMLGLEFESGAGPFMELPWNRAERIVEAMVSAWVSGASDLPDCCERAVVTSVVPGPTSGVDPYAGDPGMPPPYYGGLPARAPRTPGITRDRVEKLRRARLREGYDYNPSKLSWPEFFDRDPYRDVVLSGTISGRVIQNLTYTSHPEHETWLVIRPGGMLGPAELHVWREIGLGFYDLAVITLPFSTLAANVLAQHSASGVTVQAERLKRARPGFGALAEAVATALRFRDVHEQQPDSAGVRNWIFRTWPNLVDRKIPLAELERRYPEVFDVGRKYHHQLDEILDEIGLKQPKKPSRGVDPYAGDPDMPSPYYGGLPPRAPRTPGISRDRVEKLRRGRLREGYDYNRRR